ncbi:MAG: MarR family transcriptional regulator [Candidatus Bilamarchaeaceae archaeon]
MRLKISKNEVLALQRFCKAGMTMGELAKELGKKESHASRIVKTLESKGLVYRERRRILLSPASHAQKFKELYNSRPKAGIETWLSGHAIGILVLLSGGAIPMKTFWKEAPCSKPTVYGILKRLQGAGVLDRGSMRISDPLVGEFANEYANNIMRMATGEMEINASIRIRAHVIMRAADENAPFASTGINVLISHGLEAMKTRYNDYYLNLEGREGKIGAEEAFVHALLISAMRWWGDMRVLAKFLMKNHGLDTTKLRDLSEQYGVQGELADMRKAFDYAVD